MAETKVTLPTNKPKVELIGRDGNAFAVMGACKKAAQRAGWTNEQQEALLAEMMDGDYDHLLATALKYFTVGGRDAEEEEEEEATCENCGEPVDNPDSALCDYCEDEEDLDAFDEESEDDE